MSGPARFAASVREPWRRAWTIYSLVFVLCAAMALLVWFGFRASRQWQQSTELVAERRADETLILLAAALNKDMKGAQVSVIAAINEESLAVDSPDDLADRFARAFARFPYPESFFVWRESAPPAGDAFFFHRADRLPPWDPTIPVRGPYPVTVARNPAPTEALLDQVRGQARYRRAFAVIDSELDGTPYQIVVHLLYRGTGSGELLGCVGFMVNMQWVRDHYFSELVEQITRIGEDRGAMQVAIIDDGGRSIATSHVTAATGSAHQRHFPVLFLDPELLSSLPARPKVAQWIAQVRPGNDAAVKAAGDGARRTLLLISVAAAIAFAGLFATVRAVRASALIAAMKSDFVSTVTHELKTPLALIRLIGETLAMRRYTSAEAVHDYARLLSGETDRLERLVDNLLTYSRINDVDRLYTFEAIHPADLIEDALDPFQAHLRELRFQVSVDVPQDLPFVRADRPTIMQVFRNVIDNSIKYSGQRRALRIHAVATGEAVRFEVADAGIGIEPGELARVCGKFFRGSNAKVGGSGLGLAIAQRIVEDHGGRLELRSRLGEGTVSAVSIPSKRL
jgi:signal transduction histidine kinase